MNIFTDKTLKKASEFSSIQEFIQFFNSINLNFQLVMITAKDKDYDGTIVDYSYVKLIDKIDQVIICIDKIGNMVDFKNSPNSDDYYQMCQWFLDTNLFDTLLQLYENIYKRYENYLKVKQESK